MSKSRMIIETARNLRAKILNEQAKEPRGVHADATNSARNILGHFDSSNPAHLAVKHAVHNQITSGNERSRNYVKQFALRNKIENPDGTFKGMQDSVIAWVKERHSKNNDEG